jgi:hypothetical protein
MAQRTEGHLLRENEVETALKSLVFLTGTMTPPASESEGQVTNPL